MSTLKVDNILNTAGTDNQGKILQVVNNTTPRARYTSTSTVFIDTGFSVTITPKFASSKILLNVSGVGYSSNHYAYLDIYRNGTTSISGSATNGNGLTGPQSYHNAGWDSLVTFYQDSPNTTSAVTYNLYARTTSGTLYLANGVNAAYPNGVYILATEIAQ